MTINSDPVAKGSTEDLLKTPPAGVCDNVGEGSDATTSDAGLSAEEIAVREAAVQTIQAAYRGYQVRKTLSPEMCSAIQEVKMECNHLLVFLQEVAASLEESYRFHLIDQPDYDTQIGQLIDASKHLTSLKRDLSGFLKELPAMSPEEFQTKYASEVGPIWTEVNEVAKLAGFHTIDGALQVLVDPHWRTTLGEEAADRVDVYNRIFQPTGYAYYNVKAREDLAPELQEKLEGLKGGLIIENSAGFIMHAAAPELSRGQPHPAPLSSFDSNNLHEQMHGAEMLVPLTDENGKIDRLLALKGNFTNDPLNISFTAGIMASRKQRFEEVGTETSVPESFRTKYLEQYSVKDFLVHTADQYKTQLEEAHAEASRLCGLSYAKLGKEFRTAETKRQVEMLSLLVISEDSDYDTFLYERFVSKHRDYRELLRNCLHFSVQKAIDLKLKDIEEARKRIMEIDADAPDTKSFILASRADDDAKAKALERLRETEGMGGDTAKAEKYINTWKKIPWGIFHQEAVSVADGKEAVAAHMNKVRDTLDAAIYGQEEAKEAVMEVCGEAIARGGWDGACIGFQGPPGNGKTTLAREGIAKAFDRPFAMITLGGASDAATLTGHGYTYVGSQWGRLVDILIQSKCMNPVIYIDELDKLSQTEKGREIIGVLTHLTDPSQNASFHDNYFDGIDFDFSKCLFVFSYNDENLVNPILADRITQIRTKRLNRTEKQVIAQRYLLPELCEKTGFKKGDFTISDSNVRFIIENYTMEAGVRSLKRALHKIVRRINLDRLYNPEKMSFPMEIDRAKIIECLKEPAAVEDHIAPEPHVGVVNGLSVNSYTMTGNIMPIQVAETLSRDLLSLELTGNQKKVMRESMSNARTVAWNMLPKDIKGDIRRGDPFGLAIHCPEAAIQKDGPSAGGAITTAIISQLTGVPVRNDVAMTGEIDVRGNIRAIGGLSAKIEGAKNAGAKLVLCPEANRKDMEETKKNQPEIFENGFDAICVSHISEVLEHALCANDLEWGNFK
jgi:endopeptidase La